jgi:hypothetical protein
MNITDHLYVGAEAAMRVALAGVSRPDGIKRLFIAVGRSTVASRRNTIAQPASISWSLRLSYGTPPISSGDLLQIRTNTRAGCT